MSFALMWSFCLTGRYILRTSQSGPDFSSISVLLVLHCVGIQVSGPSGEIQAGNVCAGDGSVEVTAEKTYTFTVSVCWSGYVSNLRYFHIFCYCSVRACVMMSVVLALSLPAGRGETSRLWRFWPGSYSHKEKSLCVWVFNTESWPGSCGHKEKFIVYLGFPHGVMTRKL